MYFILVELRMLLKVLFGLCFFTAYLQVTEAQRGWGKPQNSYSSGNAGFTNWGSSSSQKQNSNLGSWGLNVETNIQTTSDPFQSWNSYSLGSNSEKPISNPDSWASNSKDTSSNFNRKNNWSNYESSPESKRKSNGNLNSFSSNNKPASNVNSDFWDSNSKDTSSNFNSGNTWNNYETTTESRKKSNGNLNSFDRKENPTSSMNSNSWKTDPKDTSDFNNGNSWNKYKTTTEGRKNTDWSLNKPTANKTPKKEKTNSGNSENWESEAFSSNNRPGDKKSASIVNPSFSGKWDTNSHLSNTNDNSIYSSWENSNTGNSNSNTGWESNSLSNVDINTNDIFSSSDYEDNSVYSSYDSNKNKKPNSNSKWESSSGNSKNDKNKGWNSNVNRENSNDKKPSNSNNQDSNNWVSNSSFNKPNEKKTTQTSGLEDENQPSRKKDHSVLDSLDQNDWYFGSASKYPSPPLKSSLNIDVSELWNFDGFRKSNQNFGENAKKSNNKNNNKNNNYNGNKRRRDRQTTNYETEIKCVCVDVTLCDEDDMIIIQEDLKDDWRPLEEFQCPRYTEVCCTNPKIGQSSRSNVIMDTLHCGQRRIVDTFHELADTVAQPGEFPWNLKIVVSESDMNCSASLIHSKMALTAAHCVDSFSAKRLKVKAGLWSTNKEPFQSRRVTKIILHPDYYSANPRNDIALLILEKPFKLTDNVNTVCLPVTNDKWDLNECFVAGWRSKEINDEVFEVLEKGKVTLLPQQECQNIMLVTDFWREYILHNSFVCAVEKNGKNKCLGDEGSPMVCPSVKSPDTYLQIGIVSNSPNCDNFGRPGIFTNVLKFLDWVNENAFDLGLFDDIDVRSLM